MGLCPDRPEGGQPDLTSGMQSGRLRSAVRRRQDAARRRRTANAAPTAERPAHPCGKAEPSARGGNIRSRAGAL